MFSRSQVVHMINRSAETPTDRRNFLRGAGLAGLGAVGAGLAVTAGAGAASAATGLSDATVLNFALNLEYLEAEFYSYAAFGTGLAAGDTTGTGTQGPVTGGKKATLTDPKVIAYAEEIANDEVAHVKFLRRELSSAAVARPAINLQESFTGAAQAAGLIKAGETFDPFASDTNFLLAAFIFEDVGVTAYKGAVKYISSKTYVEAAAGIHAVEAYHAGLIRHQLYRRDLGEAANAISDARDSLDGSSDVDQGVLAGRPRAKRANLVPTDASSVAFSRTPGQVLNVVYLKGGAVTSGGFFPAGVNGDLRTSG